MGKAGAGKRSEKRPLLQTGIGKALFGLLVLAVACAGGYWFWQSQQPDTFYYRNMEMTALDGVERNTYYPPGLCAGETVDFLSRRLQGVDVSVYQGEIDWQAVADAGWTLPSSGWATGATPRERFSLTPTSRRIWKAP